MGFCLWDLESREIPCRNDVYFNKEKMYTKPIYIVKIHRLVFQEDAQVHNKQVAMENGQNATKAQEFRDKQ